jgi:hypothetical protein
MIMILMIRPHLCNFRSAYVQAVLNSFVPEETAILITKIKEAEEILARKFGDFYHPN